MCPLLSEDGSTAITVCCCRSCTGRERKKWVCRVQEHDHNPQIRFLQPHHTSTCTSLSVLLLSLWLSARYFSALPPQNAWKKVFTPIQILHIYFLCCRYTFVPMKLYLITPNDWVKTHFYKCSSSAWMLLLSYLTPAAGQKELLSSGSGHFATGCPCGAIPWSLLIGLSEDGPGHPRTASGGCRRCRQHRPQLYAHGG